MNIKILAIFLLFFGEAVGIFAEVVTARNYAQNNPFLSSVLKGGLLMIIGAGLLILGYTMGFKAFKNIWIVSAVSITSILIVEPIWDYLIFRQTPTRGAVIGLFLGLAGFISALLYK